MSVDEYRKNKQDQGDNGTFQKVQQQSRSFIKIVKTIK